MATPGQGNSPSAARPLSSSEKADIAALALSLPPGWVVTVEPPHGQLAISPVAERRRFHRCWIASGDERRITREIAWRPKTGPGSARQPGNLRMR